MAAFEVLVLCNEPLELHPVHLLSSFDVATFRQLRFLPKALHNFPVQHLLCLAAELSLVILSRFFFCQFFQTIAKMIYICINPLTSCIAEESLSKVLLNTISSFQAAFTLILIK